MSTNLQPAEYGYISKRLLNTVTAFLDAHGVHVQIIKTKRVKMYNLIVNFQYYGNPRKTRQGIKKRIWKIYKALEAGKLIEQPPVPCEALGVTKKQCIYPFCRCDLIAAVQKVNPEALKDFSIT